MSGKVRGRRERRRNEGVVERPDGSRDDVAFHEPILDNPSADRELAEAAIRRAIDRGVEEGLARRVYGTGGGRS